MDSDGEMLSSIQSRHKSPLFLLASSHCLSVTLLSHQRHHCHHTFRSSAVTRPARGRCRNPSLVRKRVGAGGIKGAGSELGVRLAAYDE